MPFTTPAPSCGSFFHVPPQQHCTVRYACQMTFSRSGLLPRCALNKCSTHLQGWPLRLAFSMLQRHFLLVALFAKRCDYADFTDCMGTLQSQQAVGISPHLAAQVARAPAASGIPPDQMPTTQSARPQVQLPAHGCQPDALVHWTALV